MRNKSMCLALAALLLTVQWAGAQSPGEQKPPPPAKQETPKTEPAKPEEKKDTTQEPNKEKEETPDPKAPKRFIPSQRTPADNSAAFPVDI